MARNKNKHNKYKSKQNSWPFQNVCPPLGIIIHQWISPHFATRGCPMHIVCKLGMGSPATHQCQIATATASTYYSSGLRHVLLHCLEPAKPFCDAHLVLGGGVTVRGVGKGAIPPCTGAPFEVWGSGERTWSTQSL